ncbi:MAG: SH3 domain-containing protein [Synechococcus sp.]
MVQASTRVNPFPGLRSFDFGEKYLFFGRDGLADELFSRLNQHRFVAVVGPSGSGKSSLVQAGLLPAIYSGHLQDGSRWRTVILRPGGAPVRNLAVGLSQPSVLGDLLESQDEAMPLAMSVEATLKQGPEGVVQVIQQAQLQPNEKVLIVVDAFEELFRIQNLKRAGHHHSTPESAGGRDESGAAAFVSLLLAAVQQQEYPAYVVLTMRSDFIGDCAQFIGLAEAMNHSQFLLPRMTDEQQRVAISGPIDVVGGTITPDLVERLLSDMGDTPDRLSILQHALTRTWEYWQNHRDSDDEPVDVRHYEAIGTMTGALSKHADAVFEQLTVRQKEIARLLFQRLTERGQDGRSIRRPTTLFEISRVAEVSESEVREVVNRFREGGHSFLTPPPPHPLHRDTVLDISHESLMRTWGRLSHWIEREQESVRYYQQLVTLAARYRAGTEELLQEPELSLALHWRQSQRPTIAWSFRYREGFEGAIAFLQESLDAKEEELAEQKRQDREREQGRLQRVERARRIAFGTTVLALAAVSATILALFKAFEANRVRYQVERQLQRAEAERQEIALASDDRLGGGVSSVDAGSSEELDDEMVSEATQAGLTTAEPLSPDEFMSVEELMALDELLSSDAVSTAPAPPAIALETHSTDDASDDAVTPPAASFHGQEEASGQEEIGGQGDAEGQEDSNGQAEANGQENSSPVNPNRGRVTWRDGLAMRTEPNYGGSSIDGVPFNTIVTLLETSNNGDWQQIRLDSGREGWVKAGNIATLTDAESESDSSNIAIRDAQPADPEPSPPELARRVPTVEANENSSGRVTWPQGLVVRSAPGLESTYVGGIPFDAVATILERSDDGRWQRIRQDSTGLEGWVKAGNIAIQ